MEKREKMLFIDPGTLWNFRYAEERSSKKVDFYTEKNNLINFILVNSLASFGVNTVHSITDPEKFLEHCLVVIEENLESIAKKYSLHEMLFWTRRIAPINTYSRTDQTCILYREVMTNAITKYSNNSVTYIELNHGEFIQGVNTKYSGVVPKYIVGLNPLIDDIPRRVIEAIDDAYKLEMLAWYYVYTTQRYRTLVKGGTLERDYKNGFEVAASKHIGELIDLYDERSKYNQLLSRVGSYIEERSALPHDDKILIFQLNVNHRVSFPLFDLFEDIEGEVKSNYLPVPFQITELKHYMKLFEPEFSEYYGFSVDEFICLLIGYSAFVAGFFEEVSGAVSLIQRGYIVCEDMSYSLEKIIEIATELYTEEYCEAHESLQGNFRKVCDFLSAGQQLPRDIDLWTGGPRKVFYPTDNEWGIVDASGIVAILTSVMIPFASKSGEIGNRKSTHFEQKTIDEVLKIFGEDNLWLGRRKINNGENLEREIDCAFQIEDVLYILECKSVNVSFAFHRGDAKSLEFRMKKIKNEALEQVFDKVDFISKYKDTLSHPIPENVKYIVPIVVSPFPEYLWEKSELLFVAPNVPRVLTLQELVPLHYSGVLASIKKNEYTIRI